MKKAREEHLKGKIRDLTFKISY